MDLSKKLAEIEEHFTSITPEELEENLRKAGHGVIEPASKSGYTLLGNE